MESPTPTNINPERENIIKWGGNSKPSMRIYEDIEGIVQPISKN